MPRKIEKNGFTVIEILIVISIMAALLLFSISSINGFRQNEFVTTAAGNILSAVQKVRTASLDSQTDSVSDQWTLGYVMSLQNNGNNHGYCIFRWYAVPSGGVSYDPTASNFSFPGSLSYQIANAGLTLDTSSVSCPPGAQNQGYVMTDNKLFDNRSDITYAITTSTSNYCTQANPPAQLIYYIVYENLSGDVYFFDKTGHNIAAPASGVYIQVCNTNRPGAYSSTYKSIVIADGKNQPPYIF